MTAAVILVFILDLLHAKLAGHAYKKRAAEAALLFMLLDA
jgi:hypothetical protein